MGLSKLMGYEINWMKVMVLMMSAIIIFSVSGMIIYGVYYELTDENSCTNQCETSKDECCYEKCSYEAWSSKITRDEYTDCLLLEDLKK